MPCRNGFVYMGFDPPVIWIKESEYFALTESPANVPGVEFRTTNVITGQHWKGTYQKRKGTPTIKWERVIILKGQ